MALTSISRYMVTVAACVALSGTALAQESSSNQDGGEAQAAETEAIVQYIRAVVAETAAAPDAILAWQPYFVKSEGDQIYVPFTLMLESDRLTGEQVALYYSVTRKGPQMISVAVNTDEGDDSRVSVEGEVINTASVPVTNVRISARAMDASGEVVGSQSGTVSSLGPGQKAPFKISMESPRDVVQYNAVIEDAPPGFREFAIVDLPPASQSGLVPVSRAFVVSAGEYDVYMAMRERPGQAPEATPRIALLKESIEIPDLDSTLAVSSVFVADRIEGIATPLNREEQLEQPFTFGTMAVTPSASAVRSQAGELSFMFFVYNAGVDEENKPDVAVDYSFYTRTDETEEFFNKTESQAFNAETLPAQFDLSQGHQVVAGQGVPLALFVPSDYRLEITVNDGISGQSLTTDVLFTVTD